MLRSSNLVGFGAGGVGTPIADAVLLESGDYLLLETGDKLLLEQIISDPYWGSVVLLVKFDGSAIDLSTVGHTISVVADAQIDTVNFKFGSGSAFFDGNNDAYLAPGGTWWDFGTEDFTVELHAKIDGGGNDGLISRDKSAGASNRWKLQCNANGNLEWWANYDTLLLGTSSDYRTSIFLHIAISRVSGTTRMFIDGDQVATTGISYDITTSTETLSIGRDPQAANRTMLGNLDSIRITKGIGRYTTNFTPPISDYFEQ